MIMMVDGFNDVNKRYQVIHWETRDIIASMLANTSSLQRRLTLTTVRIVLWVSQSVIGIIYLIRNITRDQGCFREIMDEFEEVRGRYFVSGIRDWRTLENYLGNWGVER